MQNGEIDFFACGGWPLAGVIALSCLGIILCLGNLLDCLPSMLATLIRWKESDNINDAPHIARCRNRVAFVLTPVFLLICTRYNLIEQFSQMEPMARFGMNIVIWTAYLLLRLIIRLLSRPKAYDRKGWESGSRSHYSFFCLLTLLMAATVGILSLTGTADDVIRRTLFWEIGVLYLLNLIRKLQVFAHHRGVFSGFLYLCVLEIIPSGLLVTASILV